MKRFVAFMFLALLSSSVYAYDVWLSSNTSTTTGALATSVLPLCADNKRGVLHGICTSFGVAAASMTVVGSTWTLTGATPVVGPVSIFVADQCKYYDVFFPDGMGYYKPNVATATILYTCY